MMQKCVCHVCGKKFETDIKFTGGTVIGNRMVVACNIINPKAHTASERLASWQEFLDKNRSNLRII